MLTLNGIKTERKITELADKTKVDNIIFVRSNTWNTTWLLQCSIYGRPDLKFSMELSEFGLFDECIYEYDDDTEDYTDKYIEGAASYEEAVNQYAYWECPEIVSSVIVLPALHQLSSMEFNRLETMLEDEEERGRYAIFGEHVEMKNLIITGLGLNV